MSHARYTHQRFAYRVIAWSPAWRLALLVCCVGAVRAQNAEISGLILDPLGATVAGAQLNLRNEETGGRRIARSNAAGHYNFPSLRPGEYRLSVRAPGFSTMIQYGIRLEVGANVRLDFRMQIGDARTEITVHATPPLMNTENASVSSVIDRNLIEQMPLNGRGIQSLIELSPGVTVLPVVSSIGGQFAVNGQRDNANYYTVDGVSVNFALGRDLSSNAVTSTQIGSGMLPANNFFGTFSNLVAPESLQEFSIQTSTFAPEYGRSPGGHIALLTKSGSNRLSGSLFEYFRNDKMDAGDWFANSQNLPKAPLRFNNFGGTVGGPILLPRVYDGRDRSFFFVSVDELYTRQPRGPINILVPSLDARRTARPEVAQLLNVYPLPNRSATAGVTEGFAEYAGSTSLGQQQHAFSIRGDHSFNDRLTAFSRYSRAPSQRQFTSAAAARYSLSTDTLTLGLTHTLHSNMVHEIRLNSSRQSAATRYVLSTAGAQMPPDSFLFPSGYSSHDSYFYYAVPPAPSMIWGSGGSAGTRQKQALYNFMVSLGAHAPKFGVDYRRFSPIVTVPRLAGWADIASLYGPDGVSNGILRRQLLRLEDTPATAYLYESFSAYAQDTWKVDRKVTITYGLRWELAPGPRVILGQSAIARGDPTNSFVLAPPGHSSYQTTFSNFAPRFGLAWQAFDRGGHKTVVRLGAGRFFDLGQAGMQGQNHNGTRTMTIVNHPLGSLTPAPPCASLQAAWEASLAPYSPSTTECFAMSDTSPIAASQVRVVAPDYKPPFSWQWNFAVEHANGQQSLSAAYVAALGRRLTAWALYPASDRAPGIFINNDSASSYHSLQLQFRRRLGARLHAIASYTWSHSIDDLSSDQVYSFPNGGPTSYMYNPRRKGSSDFDIRHSFKGSIIVPLPAPRAPGVGALFRHWSVNSIAFARTALPTDILADNYVRRPDVIPGAPLYLYGPQFPGGKSYNLAAFRPPPPGRDGNFGRNVLRGLGAWQIDLGLHREFRLADDLRLQFRAESFNILNHPNFANAANYRSPAILSLNPGPNAGAASQTLANGLSPLSALGSLSPLFQIGGPRTFQFAMRLGF